MSKFLKISLIKLSIILGAIAFDQLSKVLFYGKNFKIIPFLFGVRGLSTLNTGGAWGIFGDHTWLLIIFTFCFLIAFLIFDFFFKNTNIIYSLAISFIMGGALGNLIDRIFLGGVRDFVFFEFMPSFPTFNVADIFIFCGALLLFIYVFFFSNKKSKSTNNNSQKEN